MKVWITRDVAGSVQSGGLERLWVHFYEPSFLYRVIKEKDRDAPWGYISKSNGYYSSYGWRAQNKDGISSLSFGNWLGYSDLENENKEIAIYVWNKLEEHFLNEPFSDWDKLEKEGKVRQEDFLLEIDLSIKLQPNVFETGLNEYINSLSKDQLIEQHIIHKKFLDNNYHMNNHNAFKTFLFMEHELRKAAFPNDSDNILQYNELINKK